MTKINDFDAYEVFQWTQVSLRLFMLSENSFSEIRMLRIGFNGFFEGICVQAVLIFWHLICLWSLPEQFFVAASSSFNMVDDTARTGHQSLCMKDCVTFKFTIAVV